MNLKETPIFEGLDLPDCNFSNLGFANSKEEGLLTFCESSDYINTINSNHNVQCVITTYGYAGCFNNNICVICVDNPRKYFYRLHNYLACHTDFYNIEISKNIGPNCKIHPRAYVAEKNVIIGDNTIIEPNATILENVVIGNNVIIRAGSVIGSEGFQHACIDNSILSIVHSGGVIIGNNVEIDSNCCVAKSCFGGNTIIDDDTKLDNLVHIAHNCSIGKRCRIAANAMIAGSVKMGDDVFVGPGASISSEVCIGNQSHITVGAVVTRDVLPGQKVSGNFAIDHQKYLKFIKSIRT